MKITSSAFKDGERIPRVFTCEGDNTSPPLSWQDVPAGAKSFALVCSDPDAPAGTWYHWAIYDIPGAIRELKAAVLNKEMIEGVRQGVNDFRQIGYGGPCPPHGHGDHRYFFTLYALPDETLGLGQRPGCREVEKRAGEAALEKAILIGTYSRS